MKNPLIFNRSERWNCEQRLKVIQSYKTDLKAPKPTDLVKKSSEKSKMKNQHNLFKNKVNQEVSEEKGEIALPKVPVD